MRRALGLLAIALFPAPWGHAAGQAWDGWIVGEPCAARYQVADCPLHHVDRPVLLLEDGSTLVFVHGEGTRVAPEALDKSYGKKVRMTGEIRDGVLHPLRLDTLEVSGERKFFKGCL
jgi:hypothetical protein